MTTHKSPRLEWHALVASTKRAGSAIREFADLFLGLAWFDLKVNEKSGRFAQREAREHRRPS